MNCKQLRAAPTFGAYVQKGKQALKGEDKGKLDMNALCSVDLDRRGPPTPRGVKRWDYVLVNYDQIGHAVEVHTATAKDIKEMIEKKRWAEDVLHREAGRLAVNRWHWIARSKVDIPRGGPARKLLIAAKIEYPREHVIIP